MLSPLSLFMGGSDMRSVLTVVGHRHRNVHAHSSSVAERKVRGAPCLSYRSNLIIREILG